jgi:hypothetical protein
MNKDSIGVTAEIGYAVDTGEKPVNETFEAGQIIRRRSGATEQRSMHIHDGRQAGQFSLDQHGFVLVDHPTAVADFFDPAQLQSVYYKEVETLVQKVSGASRVVVFDHTLRTGDADERETRKIREPVLWAHNDYTEWSGPQRVRDLLPDEADDLLRRRFAIIQVWRPIRHPVETFPLAIADARTLSPKNLVISERRYPDRIGQTYAITYNSDHAWYWYPLMRRDEALVFKTYESLDDGRARWTAHTAFNLPNAAPGARPRESIEIRTLAFF